MTITSDTLREHRRKLLDALSNTVPQPRVGQLDASILDSELVDLLKTQLWNVFTNFRPHLKDSYESELLLALKLLIFKLTVWDHSATYGAKLQNLKFVDGRVGTSLSRPLSRTQKLGYGLLVVGGEFLWDRLERFTSELSDSSNYDSQRARLGRVLRKLSDLLSSLWSISSLFNFLLFLYTGRYSTLILRLLRIRLVPASRSLSRQVNFEFQNRQLVWNAFTEFLFFIVPIMNLPKIKRQISKLVTKALGSKSVSTSQDSQLSFLPEKTCAICYQGSNDSEDGNSFAAHNTDVTNPYEALECKHIYCYVCITTKLLEASGEGWNCLRCTAIITKARPYVDVNYNAIHVSPAAMKEVNEVVTKEVLSKETRKDESEGESGSESDSESEPDAEMEKFGDSNDEEDAKTSVVQEDFEEQYEEEEDEDYEDEEIEGSGFVVADEDF